MGGRYARGYIVKAFVSSTTNPRQNEAPRGRNQDRVSPIFVSLDTSPDITQSSAG